MTDLFAIFPNRWKVLRAGRDWQEVHHYRTPTYTSRFIFDSFDITTQLNQKYPVVVNGSVIDFVSHNGSNGRLYWRAPGWNVAIAPLEHEVDGRLPVVSIQAQGVAWACAPDLPRCLDDLEGWLFDGVVGLLRRPGRTDLCADIWIKPGPEGEPEPGEFCDQVLGSHLESWLTKMRRTDQQWRVLRSGRGASTLYIGARARLQVRCYRKDVEFLGSTAPAFDPLWRSCGWDGTGAILRVEFEVHRAFLREHAIADLRLSKYDLDRWESSLGRVWQGLLSICSYRPGDTRKDRRAESPLWSALRAVSFEGRPIEAGVLRGAVRAADEKALLDRVNRAVWSSEEAFGRDHSVDAVGVARAPPVDLAAERERWEKRSRWAGHKARKEKEEHDRDRRILERAERESGSEEERQTSLEGLGRGDRGSCPGEARSEAGQAEWEE